MHSEKERNEGKAGLEDEAERAVILISCHFFPKRSVRQEPLVANTQTFIYKDKKNHPEGMTCEKLSHFYVTEANDRNTI